jgi:hypothetical protein
MQNITFSHLVHIAGKTVEVYNSYLFVLAGFDKIQCTAQITRPRAATAAGGMFQTL